MTRARSRYHGCRPLTNARGATRGAHDATGSRACATAATLRYAVRARFMADLLCHACRQPVPVGAQFCPACGAAVAQGGEPLPTFVTPGVAPAAGAAGLAVLAGTGGPARGSPPVEVPTYPAVASNPALHEAAEPERFPPGTLLAGRYRIE